MMGLPHPVGAVIAEGLMIDKDSGFTLGLQVKHNPLALGLRRQLHVRPKPAVFIFFSPDLAGADGGKGLLLGLLRAQLLHGTEHLPGDFSQGLIKIILQGADPVLQSACPFRMHDTHKGTPVLD